MALYSAQLLVILFTVWKANYDSVILNSVAFAFYLSLLVYQIFFQKGSLNSTCELAKYTSLNGVVNHILFEKEKFKWASVKGCINTNLIANTIIPATTFLVLPLTFSEWKLFWTGEK